MNEAQIAEAAEKRKTAKQLHAKGYGSAQIAKVIGCAVNTARRYVREDGPKQRIKFDSPELKSRYEYTTIDGRMDYFLL